MKVTQAIIVLAISCCGNLCLAVKKEVISAGKKLTSSEKLSPLHPAQKPNPVSIKIQAEMTEEETSKNPEKRGSSRKYTSLPTVSLAPSYLKKGKGKASKTFNSACPLNKFSKSKSKLKKNGNDMEDELFLESPGSYIAIIPHDDSTTCIKPAKMEEGAALVIDTCTYAGNDIFSIDTYGLIHAVDTSFCVQSEGSSLILGSCNVCSAFFQYDKETYMILFLHEDSTKVISAQNGVISLMHVIEETMSSTNQRWLPIKFYPTLAPTISPILALTSSATSKRGIKGGYSKKNKSKSTKAKAIKGKMKVSATQSPTYTPVEYRFIKCIGGDENQDFPKNIGRLSITQCAAACNAYGFLFFAISCLNLDCWCGGGEWNNNPDTECCSDQSYHDGKNFRNLAGYDEPLTVYEITNLDSTGLPSKLPSIAPSNLPSVAPSDIPSVLPLATPSSVPPSDIPSDIPSVAPSDIPSAAPSLNPSKLPSLSPSVLPSLLPTSALPSIAPTNTKVAITNENIKNVVDEYITDEVSTIETYGKIENWNVNEVSDPSKSITPVTDSFAKLFENKNLFNSDISTWDTSSGLDFTKIFSGASAFNIAISEWDTSSVTKMYQVFKSASLFNQDLSLWDLGKVNKMGWMFAGAAAFNNDIVSWDTSKVENCYKTFVDATLFNHNISGWDVANVASFVRMFENAVNFNQALCWTISPLIPQEYMFENSKGYIACGNQCMGYIECP
eukprot:CAMPEP_0194270076 /NCGR_PEP_ID=MMETSP0169-20130528/4129_1 /TAXON_ID=218684 /ORGANISM="Corethron pennatum, Strain L29A3" /LENGTH=727 /DNA_ID=CAMNT_0039011987 /DNA_START=234 /DNA_END=2417 /DNA_ORIENTATION=-